MKLTTVKLTSEQIVAICLKLDCSNSFKNDFFAAYCDHDDLFLCRGTGAPESKTDAGFKALQGVLRRFSI